MPSLAQEIMPLQLTDRFPRYAVASSLLARTVTLAETAIPLISDLQ